MVENITIINKKSKASLELDVVKTPFYILESVDWGQVTSSAQTYKYANQVGESVENILIGTREISIIGWVIADTELEMSMRKRAINTFVNPLEEMEILYKQYVLRFFPDKSIQYGLTMQENNEYMTKFKISGICYNPLFVEEFNEFADIASVKGHFHFPLIINKDNQDPPTVLFGVRQPSLITTIYNEGQTSTGFKVIFSASARLQSPSIINILTQEYIKINKTMKAGERIEINTSRGERKIVGTFNGTEENYSKYRDLDMNWMQLKVGENNFRYDAETGLDNLDVYIYFDNKYLEVQECN